jgi:copper homeostasis protein (lipoprotein)
MKHKLFLLMMVLLLSCNSAKNDNALLSPLRSTESAILEDSNSLHQAFVYQGVLPCADCSGIETTLKIYQGDGTMESHTFELVSIYKGKKPEKKWIKKGTYNLERGLEDDPDGTIYILNWDKPETEHIYYGYYSKNPDKIYLLNNKRQIIKSELNYSLVLRK